MPRSGFKRVPKFSLESLPGEEEHYEKPSLLSRRVAYVERTKSAVRYSAREKKLRSLQARDLKTLKGKLERARTLDGIRPKSKINVVSAESSMKSQDIGVNRIPIRTASLLSQNTSGSNLISGSLIDKERAAGQFLSVLTDRGRLMASKAAIRQSGPHIQSDSETRGLSHAEMLTLYRALLKKPLPYLELHGRFDVSKQTLKRLVRNRILTEVWGPRAIGVKFKLSEKGRNHFKMLETAARYKPRIGKNAVIRLKQISRA